MPTTFTLQSPTDVSRTGSNKTWTNIANILNSPPSYATIGAFVPADKGDYVRINIAAPGVPLGVLPAHLLLNVNAALTTTDVLGGQIVEDVIQLGPIGGPGGLNAATVTPYTSSDAVRQYLVDTSGITLGQLNGGNAYVYVGVRANPTDAFNAGHWTITYTSSGSQAVNGVATPWGASSNLFSYSSPGHSAVPWEASETGSITCIATWNGSGGPTPDPYVVLSVESKVSAFGSCVSPPPPVNTASAVVNDGFGNSTSVSNNGSASASFDTTKKVLVPTVAGVATFTVAGLVADGSTYSPGVINSSITVSVQVIATPVAPDPMSLRMDGLMLTDNSTPIGVVLAEQNAMGRVIPPFAYGDQSW